jgi:DNA-binding transcriptional ArsR family regulator
VAAPPHRSADGEVVLRDPRDIRALAHPARLSALSELEGDAELTATELATRAGITPSAMSYHLRALERVGILTRGEPRGDGRERPWRAAGGGLRIESASPAATAPAEELVIGGVLDRTRRAFGDWLMTQDRESPEWREVPSVRRSAVWLTADEAQELALTIESLVKPYVARRDPERRPEGAREVETLTVIVPKPIATAER